MLPTEMIMIIGISILFLVIGRAKGGSCLEELAIKENNLLWQSILKTNALHIIITSVSAYRDQIELFARIEKN